MSSYMPEGRFSDNKESKENVGKILFNSVLASPLWIMIGGAVAEISHGSGRMSSSGFERYVDYMNIYSSFIGNDMAYAIISICITVAAISFFVSKSYVQSATFPLYISMGIGLGTSISFAMSYFLIAGILFSIIGTVVFMAALPTSLIEAFKKN